MLFPTDQFAIFFPIVLVLNWLLMSRPWAWKPFILFASYVFYACASPIFCVLLAGVTVWNAGAARLIERSESERRREWICRIAVTGNLINLGFFDYYTFFASALSKGLHGVGLGMPLPLLTVALPVGISFYTFQAISYTVDVKRGVIKPYKLLDVAIYLSFFPHLAAGPIVRAREFLPQLMSPRDPNTVAVSSGLWLIGVGLIKKVVLADYIGRVIVDPVYATPHQYHTLDVLLAVWGFPLQIYCDFAGYTDMAIGLALLMGFVFPNNFNNPFRAASITELWNRWHMTLSRFMRDFVYIPLGGSRGSRLFQYRNLIITFTLVGLWHGAAWTFVIWGAYNGVLLVLENRFAGRLALPRWIKILWTFNLFALGGVLFRAQSLSLSGQIFHQMFSWGSITLWKPLALLAVAGALVPQWLPEGWTGALREWCGRQTPVLVSTGLVVLILFVAATVPTQGVPDFIYFRF